MLVVVKTSTDTYHDSDGSNSEFINDICATIYPLS